MHADQPGAEHHGLLRAFHRGVELRRIVQRAQHMVGDLVDAGNRRNRRRRRRWRAGSSRRRSSLPSASSAWLRSGAGPSAPCRASTRPCGRQRTFRRAGKCRRAPSGRKRRRAARWANTAGAGRGSAASGCLRDRACGSPSPLRARHGCCRRPGIWWCSMVLILFVEPDRLVGAGLLSSFSVSSMTRWKWPTVMSAPARPPMKLIDGHLAAEAVEHAHGLLVHRPAVPAEADRTVDHAQRLHLGAATSAAPRPGRG
jgi:hypothetical protein